MKLITLFAIVICLIGCGPHFSMHPRNDKDTYVEPATKTPLQNVQISLPNWPLYAYRHNSPDIIIIMAIREIGRAHV